MRDNVISLFHTQGLNANDIFNILLIQYNFWVPDTNQTPLQAFLYFALFLLDNAKTQCIPKHTICHVTNILTQWSTWHSKRRKWRHVPQGKRLGAHQRTLFSHLITRF